MKNCHKSEKLDALLGKKVKIIMYDGAIHTGVLRKDTYSDRYRVERNGKGGLCFYKTHIRKVEEAW